MTNESSTIDKESASSQRVIYPVAGSPVAVVSVGNVQIVQSDERHLDIRYGDKSGSLGWLLPIEHAEDLVRWWVEQGRMQAPRGGLAPPQCFNRIWVSIPSDRLVYVRGSNILGKYSTGHFRIPGILEPSVG